MHTLKHTSSLLTFCDGTSDLLLLMCSEGRGRFWHLCMCLCVFIRIHACALVRLCVCASVLHLGRVKELSGQITSRVLLGFSCLSVSAQMKICSTQITRVPSHRFLGNPSCLKPLVAVLLIVSVCASLCLPMNI